jgi:hypothetical protein
LAAGIVSFTVIKSHEIESRLDRVSPYRRESHAAHRSLYLFNSTLERRTAPHLIFPAKWILLQGMKMENEIL